MLPSHFVRTLQEVEGTYRDNPYHNSTHAADVTQSLGCLLSNDDFSRDLTDIELLSMIVAAAVHDVGHPGHSSSVESMDFVRKLEFQILYDGISFSTSIDHPLLI